MKLFRSFHLAAVVLVFCHFFLLAQEKPSEKPVSKSSTDSTGIKAAPKPAMAKVKITSIDSMAQFNKLLEKSGDRLLMFDLYADWCMPCKILSPTIEKIAVDYAKSLSVYKINIDKQPALAQMFGAQSIPLIVFVRNKKGVNGVMGMQPREVYTNMIDEILKQKPAPVVKKDSTKTSKNK